MVAVALGTASLDKVERSLGQELLGLRRLDGRADALLETVLRRIEEMCALIFRLGGNRNPLACGRVVLECATDVIDDFLVHAIEGDIGGERQVGGGPLERVSLAEVEDQPFQSNAPHGSI